MSRVRPAGTSWRCSSRLSVAVTSAVAGVLLLVSGTPAHADGVPYTDERSGGSLTFCDAAGHELTHSSVATRPFVHLVVAQTAAPAGYDDGRGTATLYAYSPRAGLAPGQWGGELLTGASRFADPHHPAVVALPEDLSLGGYAADFPIAWNGLVQLRVYLGAPGRPILNQSYDSAEIQISGDRWTLVRGGGSSCKGVKAVAVAQLLGVQASAAPANATSSHASGMQQAGRVRPSTAVGPVTEPDAHQAVAAAQSLSGSRDAVVLGGLVLLLLVGGGALLVSRRRTARLPAARA